MSKAKCYLCATSGDLRKLFRKCKHESACRECLRSRFVTKAQQDVSLYPLKCFHPECNLEVGSTQIRRLVRSEQELQIFHQMDRRAKSVAKMQKVQAQMRALAAQKHAAMHTAMRSNQWGENWQELWRQTEEVSGDTFTVHAIRHCAECQMLQATWQEIKQILGEAFPAAKIRRCPECKMLITKNGGCSHMRCICGCNFSWASPSQVPIQKVQDSFQKMEDKYSRYIQFYFGMINPSRKPVSQSKNKKRAPVVKVVEEEGFYYELDDIYQPHYWEVQAMEAEEDWAMLLTAIEKFDKASNLRSTKLEAIDTLDCNATSSLDGTGRVPELPSDTSNESRWSQCDDYSDFSSRISSDSGSQTATAWEEVSEVSSVVSFHSKTGMSFLEAACTAAVSNEPRNEENQRKEVSKVARPMSQTPLRTVVERNMVSSQSQADEIMFDADFMLEGVKRARGGKLKFKTKVFS